VKQRLSFGLVFALLLLSGCVATDSNSAASPPGASSATASHATHKPKHASPKPGANGSPAKVPGVPAVDLPNRALTPGVALAVTVHQICTPGYSASVRNVSDALKAQVYARYNVAWVPYQHEVDHLISLELGGSNSILNLWPEPYAGVWGARTKDVLENKLHDLVCAGSLSLQSAQLQEATNWVAAYKRYVGAAPSGGGSGSSTSSGGYYASRYPTASTIYCADDSGWKSLSKTYLVHFATLAQALARFPSYHLHQPC
jgi:hypothetical protein